MLALSLNQSRELDLLARQALGLSDRELIARAGQASAEFAQRRFGPLQGKTVGVLCGKGHNAADGLVAAAHLARAGSRLFLWLAFDPGELAPDARWALDQAREAGAELWLPGKDSEGLQDVDLIVDALVGVGARLPLQGGIAELVEAANGSGRPVLALDLPSGVDAETGACGGSCILANATLTFFAPKLGLLLGPGRAKVGHLEVAPLGISSNLGMKLTGPLALGFDSLLAASALPPRKTDAHKRQGLVLLIAGSADYPGAALLCARGAYRCGAGLVRLAVPSALAPLFAMAFPELVVASLPADSALDLSHLDELLALAADAGAVVVGPGLGRRKGTLALVAELWKRLPQPAVFDADALFDLAVSLPAGGPRILTPHEGELKQLQGPDALKGGRIAAARRLALTANCPALLKGPATLVALPDGSLSINTTGNPALATAGSGDVLSGAVAALMAQGAGPFAAGSLGAWLHGLAADQWVQAHGGRGLLASDLADALPHALASAGA